MSQRTTSDLLGAHVSIQGGVPTAPARGMAIGASAVQVFTKTPNQWREPDIEPEVAEAPKTDAPDVPEPEVAEALEPPTADEDKESSPAPA